MTNHANNHINRMSSAAQQAADAVSHTLNDLPENLKNLNRQMADRASEGLDALSGMANQCLEQGRDRVTDMERALEKRVREQPLHALLIAFGIGAAFAYLARSRH